MESSETKKLRMDTARDSMVAEKTNARERLRAKLIRELGCVAKYLAEEDTIEISVNPDGSVWVERLGKSPQLENQISRAQVGAALATIAATLGTTINANNPILSGELLIDGSRVEGLYPPIVTSPSYSIRRRASQVFTLEQYVESGVMTTNQFDLVCGAVESRKNILVVGGTSTGKTTLTNAVISKMGDLTPDDRLVIIEDTYEIQCSALNKVMLHANDQVSMDRLLRSTLRLAPDRILVGEVRGPEALALLKAWNTGHPGGVATLHANDTVAALQRLEQLAAEGSKSAHQIPHLVAEAVDVVIHIAKGASGRKIQNVLSVSGYENGGYITKHLNT